MQRSQNDNESRIDWGIIFCVLLLALIGLASIYVAASNDKTPTSITRQVVSQLIWYIIGTIMIIVIMQFDAEQLWKIAPIVYWLGIFLMFAILVDRTTPVQVPRAGLPLVRSLFSLQKS